MQSRLVNLVTPTSAVVMGGLAIARVGYGTWLKFVWRVLIVLAVLTMAVLSVAMLVQLEAYGGPRARTARRDTFDDRSNNHRANIVLAWHALDPAAALERQGVTMNGD